MKSTVVDESLSSFKPMYCSREYQTSTRLNQQYEKSTLKAVQIGFMPNMGACIDPGRILKKTKEPKAAVTQYILLKEIMKGHHRM